MKKTILVTGGAGFIGSHVTRLFVNKYPDYKIIVLDKYTYASNSLNLKDVSDRENYGFNYVDITMVSHLKQVFNDYEKIDGIIHLAAETHVDNSIHDPSIFVSTNVVGTHNLLELAKKKWSGDFKDKIFLHISTDEVYGEAVNGELFTEQTNIKPRSPYSATKASSDHLVSAYYHTYGLPTIITRCSNNYGPNQFPEKLIPLMINKIVKKEFLPVYGTGKNIRDWLYVEDHADAIDMIFHKGKIGEVYNIGGNNEWRNIDIVEKLCDLVDKKLNRNGGDSKKLIKFVEDRLGHDLRYAIDSTKIRNEIGWSPKTDFEIGLKRTVDWYIKHILFSKNFKIKSN